MARFVLCACLYLFSLFALLDHFPDGDQAQLLHELALDQAEFNQSLSEIPDLKILDPVSPLQK